jgi:hypothetical protein
VKFVQFVGEMQFSGAVVVIVLNFFEFVEFLVELYTKSLTMSVGSNAVFPHTDLAGVTPCLHHVQYALFPAYRSVMTSMNG